MRSMTFPPKRANQSFSRVIQNLAYQSRPLHTFQYLNYIHSPSKQIVGNFRVLRFKSLYGISQSRMISAGCPKALKQVIALDAEWGPTGYRELSQTGRNPFSYINRPSHFSTDIKKLNLQRSLRPKYICNMIFTLTYQYRDTNLNESENNFRLYLLLLILLIIYMNTSTEALAEEQDHPNESEQKELENISQLL